MSTQGGGKANHGHASMDFYSPRYSPAGLPPSYSSSSSSGQQHSTGVTYGTGATTDQGFFGPTSTASPATMTAVEDGKVQNPAIVPVPDLHVQGPSPEPAEPTDESSSSTTPTIPTFPSNVPKGFQQQRQQQQQSPKRPGMIHRNYTSPAIITPSIARSDVVVADSPPQLSNSSTDTPVDSPRSPVVVEEEVGGGALGVMVGGDGGVGGGKWSPTVPGGHGGKGMGDGYKGFIEQSVFPLFPDLSSLARIPLLLFCRPYDIGQCDGERMKLMKIGYEGFAGEVHHHISKQQFNIQISQDVRIPLHH